MRLETLILQGNAGESYDTFINEAAKEIANAISEEYKNVCLPNFAKELKFRSARAIRAVIAGCGDDAVTTAVLQSNGSVKRTRMRWGVVTATITSTVVAGVLAGYGFDGISRQVVAGVLTSPCSPSTPGSVLMGRLLPSARNQILAPQLP